MMPPERRPRTAFDEVMFAEMEQTKASIMEMVQRQVFGPPWLSRDRNPFPTLILFPRLYDLERWVTIRRARIRAKRRDALDAWYVLRHGLPDDE